MRASYDTWRWKSGLASWSYSLPARPGETTVQCLDRCVVDSMGRPSPFARISMVTVGTRERGDHAYRFRDAEIDSVRVHEAIVGPEEVQRVILTLDLGVTLGEDETETWLERAASLFFEFDEQSEVDHSIKMWLSLDVDIYSPTTWGDSRDNAERARRNGPRLTQFLQMVQNVLGGTLEAIDTDGYTDHVDENGFRQ